MLNRPEEEGGVQSAQITIRKNLLLLQLSHTGLSGSRTPRASKDSAPPHRCHRSC